jgi:transposase InsO family protein
VDIGFHLCRHRQGFVYVAFVIEAFARRIVGWRVSRTAHAGFVLDALEQALHDRRPVQGSGLIHHSDRGVQYVSIRYTERLAEAGTEPSVGSRGDSYDNALAETINGLFKTEVIRRRGPWRSLEAKHDRKLVHRRRPGNWPVPAEPGVPAPRVGKFTQTRPDRQHRGPPQT